MQFSIAIIVPNREFIMVILDMHIFRFLKGKFKGLFVFHANYLSNRIPLEDILIIPAIQMQDLLHDHPVLEVQLMQLHAVVIYEEAGAVGAVGGVIEGDFDDVLAYLKGYIVLGLALVDDGCD